MEISSSEKIEQMFSKIYGSSGAHDVQIFVDCLKLTSHWDTKNKYFLIAASELNLKETIGYKSYQA